MYEQVYNFQSRPFTSTPYVKHYFAGEAIHSALGQTRVSIDRASGPVIVVGGIGTGKTLMLAMLEEQYRTQFTVVNPGCVRLNTRTALLQAILFELDQSFAGLNESELRFALIEYLKPNERCPNGVLLLIDEAHSLSIDLLDELRLITNFVRDGQPRVRLVLAGNQRLEDTLSTPKLDSFNQRIASRCYLRNMNREDTSNYVREHIQRVGGDAEQLFPEDSLRAVHSVSDGCPRLINQVCDHALILAATHGMTTITDECVNEAWAVVQSIPGVWNPGSAAQGQQQTNESATDESTGSSSSLQSDEDWTVIEFGELDDDESSSETTYEFGQAEPAEAEEPTAQPKPDDQLQASSLADLEIEEDDSLANESLLSRALAADPIDETSEQVVVEIIPDEEQLGLGAITSAADLLNQSFDDESYQEHDEQPSSAQESLLAEMDGDASRDEIEPASETIAESETFVTEEALIEKALGLAETEVAETEEAETEEAVPAACEDSTDAAENLESFAEEAAATPTASTPPTPTAFDPFDEEFEEEEHLVDRYAPFVAYQNKTSLDVTSEELCSLKPTDEISDLDSVATLSVTESTTQPEDTSEYQEANSQQPSPQPLDPQSDPFANLELAVEAEADQGESSQEVSDHSFTGEMEIENAEETSQAEPTSLTAERETNPSDSSSVSTYTDDEDSELKLAPAAPLDPDLSQIMLAQHGSATAENEDGEFHEHITEASSEDIQAEAAAILARIGQLPNEPVANEPIAIKDVTNEPVSHETENPASTSASTPTLNAEVARQTEAVEETQKILDEILQQKQILAQETQQTPIDSEESVSLQYPGTENTDQRQDDREMIFVNQMKQPNETPKSDETVPFVDTPITTGRAERMDYQKLFDQLRDASDSSQ